jgi:hypothetical protein
MSIVRNSDALSELRSEARIQTSTDSIPSKLNDTVVPTMEMNPNLSRRTTTVKVTAYTPATNRRFNVTGVFVSYVKAVGDTGTQVGVYVTVNGLIIKLVALCCTTLTVEKDSIFLSFEHPLELDPGSAITPFNTGSFNTFVTSVFGYETQVE